MYHTFIGLAGLTLSNDKFRLGEIYYKLNPIYWEKGYATEVSRALIKSGFEYFHLHKVEAGVAVQNVRSIKVLEKSGMTREGLRRKILPIRGNWIDNYHYAIVEDDPRDY
jgi:ribosomal-protein-alanine N-acetyltransferase